jgi:hypothetical protein
MWSSDGVFAGKLSIMFVLVKDGTVHVRKVIRYRCCQLDAAKLLTSLVTISSASLHRVDPTATSLDSAVVRR